MNSMPVCKNSFNDFFLKEGGFIKVAPCQKLH